MRRLPRTRDRIQTRSRRFRPHLEPLEDRCVMSLFQPIGAFPAIGADSMPSIIFTIGAGTITTTRTGQPAYERVEDAYVGVRNLSGSNVPLTSLNLAGPVGFTEFDGDGIDPSPNPTSGLSGLGVAYGPTGYEGPGTFYSNYTMWGTSLKVNFNDPSLGGGLPPGYHSAWNCRQRTFICSSLCRRPNKLPSAGPPGSSIWARSLVRPPVRGTLR